MQSSYQIEFVGDESGLQEAAGMGVGVFEQVYQCAETSHLEIEFGQR